MVNWEGLEKAIESELSEYQSGRELFKNLGVDNPNNSMSKIDYEARIFLYRKAVRILTLIDVFNSEFPDSSQYKEMYKLACKLVEAHESVFIQEGLNSIVLERQILNYKKAVEDYGAALKILLANKDKSIRTD